jgi:hypothetical protein
MNSRDFFASGLRSSAHHLADDDDDRPWTALIAAYGRVVVRFDVAVVGAPDAIFSKEQ